MSKKKKQKGGFRGRIRRWGDFVISIDFAYIIETSQIQMPPHLTTPPYIHPKTQKRTK